MQLDLAGPENDMAYKVLTALVTPRPIAWVSTLNEDGTVNAAPFSFFNVFGDSPPLVILGIGNRSGGQPKDTVRNAEREGEFVVNLVDEAVAEAMNRSAASLAYGVSELEEVGCHAAPGMALRTPRIAEAPAALECRLQGIQTIGNNRLLLGLVGKVWVREGILDPRNFRLVPGTFSVVGRMEGPDGYVRCRDRFTLSRPG